MYGFSRRLYRELARDIVEPQGPTRRAGSHEQVLRACERAIVRLATDRDYFANPARTLFQDIRAHFPLGAQERVWRVVHSYMACAEEVLSHRQRHGFDLDGKPVQCRASTRRGVACQREPLPHNGYCPSHQHLAATESRPHQPPARPLAA